MLLLGRDEHMSVEDALPNKTQMGTYAVNSKLTHLSQKF